MSEELQPEIVRSTSTRRRLISSAVVLLDIFLLGFIPMWLRARESARGLAESEHQLLLVRMQSNLASAVIDARRGDYEPARQAASQFFTSLSTEIDKGNSSAFTQAQREGLQPL